MRTGAVELIEWRARFIGLEVVERSSDQRKGVPAAIVQVPCSSRTGVEEYIKVTLCARYGTADILF